jgi:hypothetical protein
VALRSRPAGGGFKPPPAALAEDRRGERGGKGALDASGGDREDGAQLSWGHVWPRGGRCRGVVKAMKVASKPGRWIGSGMSLAGVPLTGQVVLGIEAT